MRTRTFLPIATVAISIDAASASKIENEEAGRQRSPDFDDGKGDNQNSCGLYLATSSTSLPNDHKWGVYVGKDIEKASPIGFGDLSIQIFNLMANNIWMNENTEEIMDDLDKNNLANLVDWFEQFVWVPNSSGGQFELIEDGSKIVTAIPGTGVLGGYNPRMTNADFNHSSAYHREAWNEFPEEEHPGRGAYSNYFNLELASTEVIPAGREVFIHYGDNWEEETEKEKETLTRADYDKVDKTIEKMIEFFQKHDGKLDDSSKKKIYDFLRLEVMDAAAGSEKSPQIRNMLPNDPAGLQQILDNGGSFSSKAPGSARTIEWLQENGMCMDNIKPGPSTIPYAGRGAFANGAIKKGNLVAPVPLIQISDETILDMHEMESAVLNSEAVEEEDAEPEYMLIRESSEVHGLQLLMNYCWGHPKSSTLFFPVGAIASYINHAPSKDKVNAKMIWSEHLENRVDLFEEPLPQFVAMGRLVIEIVATRDIEEGEEVFIDYGEEWQEAWDRHVEEWNKNKEGSWPMQALDFNQEHKTKPFRTLDDEPYPDNVMVKCFLMVKKPSGGEIEIDDEGRKIRNWSEADSGKTNLVSNNLFDCEIKSHEETSDGHSYDVLWNSGKSINVVKGVPHRAIVLVDRPEEGDQHIWNSFRHYVNIGDIYPKAWQDLSDDEDEEDYHDGGEL
eukprot:CAMPEP_0197175438 /NCGR_PEP_ID=MMETSP1423-20130617/1655_1 /TAXON_ID=476441 /ORGANISM="Pseudo-nitzschia heimii, Strain UNC1101" /LENGTH=673 /DNA_ID=CAMNT_0042624601 /DNA_START=56 /DNA_END=2077 /DNA_ORIENTATION=+